MKGCAKVKERPILFSTAMVCAILDGQKTQTRRIVKDKIKPIINECFRVNGKWCNYTSDYDLINLCPYGAVGDRLWVRETFAPVYDSCEHSELIDYPEEKWISGYAYKAYGVNTVDNWKPSIFMPREASRIMLEITGIRVERLQVISEEDAKAEGVEKLGNILLWTYKDYLGKLQNRQLSAIESYQTLWESINGSESWDLNPWVWVVAFKRI